MFLCFTASTIGEFGGGCANRNSIPLFGTWYFLSVCLLAGGTEASVCRAVSAGSGGVSLMGMMVLEEVDVWSVFGSWCWASCASSGGMFWLCATRLKSSWKCLKSSGAVIVVGITASSGKDEALCSRDSPCSDVFYLSSSLPLWLQRAWVLKSVLILWFFCARM